MSTWIATAAVVSMLIGSWCAVQTAPSGGGSGAIVTEPLVHEGVINAPVEEVWAVFTTAEGFRKLGVAHADVDLRVGGLIRSHYRADGVLGDEETIQNEIMAFEPMRMISFRITKPPQGFPFPNAWKDTWAVATFTDLGDGTTHLRLAGIGYTADEESQAMRRFFLTGNEWTIRKLRSAFDSTVASRSPAEAHADSPLAPIRVDAVVEAPREEVWRTLTTSAGWRAFFGVESRIGTMAGDPFEVYFVGSAPAGERGSEGCTILSQVPGEMYSFSWNAPPQFSHARGKHTWVVVDFVALTPTRTRVTLRHLGFDGRAQADPDHAEEWGMVRAYFAAAWPRVLGKLSAHHGAAAERGSGEH